MKNNPVWINTEMFTTINSICGEILLNGKRARIKNDRSLKTVYGNSWISCHVTIFSMSLFLHKAGKLPARVVVKLD